jgi:hypothetical protein
MSVSSEAATATATAATARPPIRRRRSAGRPHPPAPAPVLGEGEALAAEPAPAAGGEGGEAGTRPRRLRKSRPRGTPTVTVTAAQVAAQSDDRTARRPRPRAGWRRLRGATGQALLAAACWLALVALVYFADPGDHATDTQGALARSGFFVALFGALFFTLAPALRGIARRFARSRIYKEAAAGHATRQALLVATLVVLNAVLQLVRAWTQLNAVLLLGVFTVFEIVALARR